MSGSHYKQVCEQCGGVIAQCRCMSCDKAVVVKGLCAKCAAQPQDKGSAGQQSGEAPVQHRKAKSLRCSTCGWEVCLQRDCLKQKVACSRWKRKPSAVA